MHTPLWSPSPRAVNDSVRGAAARYRRARRPKVVGTAAAPAQSNATSGTHRPRVIDYIMDPKGRRAHSLHSTSVCEVRVY